MLTVLGVAAVALLVGGVVVQNARRGRDLSGTLSLNSGHEANGPSCRGTGGYDDIRIGAQVTVTDEGGTVVATGQLQGGTVVGRACIFRFDVAGVPDRPFYGIEVSHRGVVRFSKADMDADGWTAGLTLG